MAYLFFFFFCLRSFGDLPPLEDLWPQEPDDSNVVQAPANKESRSAEAVAVVEHQQPAKRSTLYYREALASVRTFLNVKPNICKIAGGWPPKEKDNTMWLCAYEGKNEARKKNGHDSATEVTLDLNGVQVVVYRCTRSKEGHGDRIRAKRLGKKSDDHHCDQIQLLEYVEVGCLFLFHLKKLTRL
jgi:hypothetical protein